jgi:Ferritin-like domain
MDTGARRGHTRRELVRRGLVVGGAGAAALLLDATRSGAQTQPVSDAQLLIPLIGTELLAAFGYQQVLQLQLLSPRGDRLAQRLLEQEQEHITALTGELAKRGHTPPPPISSVADADTVLAARQVPERLDNLHSAHDAILLLSRFELMLEGAYIHAIKLFRSPQLLRLGGQIIANEGQHGVMLSELLHPGDVQKAVPSSNVLGVGT